MSIAPKLVLRTMLASNVGLCKELTTSTLPATSNGAGNYGAWQIDRYGEKLVLLEQVLCELFRLAWPIHCLPSILSAKRVD